LFSPSGFLTELSLENPNWLDTMHFSIDFFISNKCIEDLSEVQAIKFKVGWNVIEAISALPAPLLSSYSNMPSSELNIRIIVPLIEAVASKVP
jgi:hypothetical protein